jgi:HEAT repeat protein
MKCKKVVLFRGDMPRLFAICLLLSAIFHGQSFGAGTFSNKDVKALLERVGTPSLTETNQALETLISAGAKVVTNLVTIISEDVSSARIRANAALVIGAIAYRSQQNISFDAAVIPLAKCLEEEDRELKVQAAQALGAIGEIAKKAVPQLIKAVDSVDHSLRFCALESLGRIGPSANEAVPVITKATNDPAPDIRIIARQSLFKIQTPEKQKPN